MDSLLLGKLKRGDNEAYEKIYHMYFMNLYLFVKKIVEREDVAKDIIQDAFIALFDYRDKIISEKSIKYFLFKSIKNSAFNYIKHTKVEEKYKNYARLQPNCSYYIEDGSFIRLSNVILGYTYRKTRIFEGAGIYISGQNLLLLTDYQGYDPKVNLRGQSVIERGNDFNSYPRPS